MKIATVKNLDCLTVHSYLVSLRTLEAHGALWDRLKVNYQSHSYAEVINIPGCKINLCTYRNTRTPGGTKWTRWTQRSLVVSTNNMDKWYLYSTWLDYWHICYYFWLVFFTSSPFGPGSPWFPGSPRSPFSPMSPGGPIRPINPPWPCRNITDETTNQAELKLMWVMGIWAFVDTLSPFLPWSPLSPNIPGGPCGDKKDFIVATTVSRGVLF